MAHELAGRTGLLEHILVVGDKVEAGGVDLRALCAPAPDPDAARAELDETAPSSRAVALFRLSGGTTGLPPKLIARTHDDFAYGAKRSAEVCGFWSETVYLAVLPLSHNFTLGGPGILGALLAGGRVVIAASPAPEHAFKVIENEGVTVTSLVPAIVQRWLEHRETDRRHDLGSLALLQVGGARIADHLARRVSPILGCTLQQGYGMAEGFICFTRPGEPVEITCRTQGRPMSSCWSTSTASRCRRVSPGAPHPRPLHSTRPLPGTRAQRPRVHRGRVVPDR